MSTKKRNRRHVVRAQRKILNARPEFFAAVSGRRLNRFGYGAGITLKSVRENGQAGHE